ncbi:MAG: A24 family peptidase C-terminal domain-containing protein [Promethearchaeota archaeon]
MEISQIAFLYIFLYFTALILLIYAVYQDVIERMVSDYIWIAGTIIGIGAYFLHFFLDMNGTVQILPHIFINLFTALIFSLIFYAPKYFTENSILGEADILAFSMTALLMPVRFNESPYINQYLVTLPTIFDIICNCFILFGFFLIAIFFRNLIFGIFNKEFFSETCGNLTKKIISLFTGILVKVENLDKYTHFNLLEVYNDENEGHLNNENIGSCNWNLDINFSNEEEFPKNELIQLKEEILSTGKKYIWITLLIPFMIFILFSAIITPWTGNLIFKVLESMIY